MFSLVVWLIVGLGLLIAGAELLVRGASSLAAAAGVHPLVIGLTVVAFGTSAPELAVSVKASLAGQSGVALGNVIGSNTFNVLFILGLSALVSPLAVASRLVRFDLPLVIGVSVLVIVLARDGAVDRADGAVLLVGIVLYTLLQARLAQGESAPKAGVTRAAERPGVLWPSILVLAGLSVLVVGSRLLVAAAVGAASALGVSELVVGLTIVAAGTSLPELVTSVVASLRGERDLAVGNVVGSNLFNLLAVLGAAAVMAPGGVAVETETLRIDLPVMAATAAICLPLFFTQMTIARWEGALLLAFYVAYTTHLVLAATGSPLANPFGQAMVWGVLPVTGAALLWSLTAEWWRRRP